MNTGRIGFSTRRDFNTPPSRSQAEEDSFVRIDSKYDYSFKHGDFDVVIKSENANLEALENVKIHKFYYLLYKQYNQAGWRTLLANHVPNEKKEKYYSISFPVRNAESGSSYILHQRTKVILASEGLELMMQSTVIGTYYGQPYVVEGRFDDEAGILMEKETRLLKQEVISKILGLGGFPFTTREFDILELLYVHNSSAGAGMLEISRMTMNTHCRNIVKKSKLISPYLETTKDVSRYFHNLGLI